MKIAFLGDIHGKKANPLDRLCDYNEDLYEKLSWVIDYANDNDIRYLVHLGDMTDKPEMPEELKNRLIQILRRYKGTFLSIIGMSHDLFYNNEQSYCKTCLYNLELSGVLKVIREPIRIEDVNLIPLSMRIKDAKKQLKTEINEMLDSSMENILLGHLFYEWGLSKSSGLLEEDFSEITKNCSLILGHDHRQHDTVYLDKVSIYRPGSFMRTELSEHTISMHPRMLIYDNHIWNYHEIPHKSISSIYNIAEYKHKKDTMKAFRNLKNNLEDISRYFRTDGGNIVTCSKALKDLNCPDAEYEYLKYVHQYCGKEF